MDTFFTPPLPVASLDLSCEAQHSGKWTMEEKQYSDALAAEFQSGTLDIEEGISLRRFLAQALRCSAKRISKKYEGNDYNGKMLYQKSERTIPLKEAKERNDRLKDLKHKYQESLKVLKMVEDSKRSDGVPSTSSRDSVRRFLVSTGSILGMSGLGYSPRVSGLSMAAAGGRLEASLVATRSPSLSFQAHLTQSSGLVATRLPFATGTPARKEVLPLGNEALSRFRGKQSLQKFLRAGAGTSDAAILRKLAQARPSFSSNREGLSPLQSAYEENDRRLGVFLRRGPSPSTCYSQAMILPKSISTLHSTGNRSVEVKRREDSVINKSSQNALILEALLNRERGVTSAFQETAAAGRKRQSEELEMAASKFARLV